MFGARHQNALPAVYHEKLIRPLRIGAGLLLAIFAAQGTTLLDITSAIDPSDPTQLGRILRDGIISDWSQDKLFPGVLNPTTSYHYHAYSVPISSERYIEITFNDFSFPAFDFISAFANSYNPAAGLDVNYLGDDGATENFFGDPFGSRFFQIFAPPSVTNLVLVVNDSTLSGLGVGAPFEIVVNSYLDTSYNSVPEPSTFAFFLSGGLLLSLIAMLRRRTAQPQAIHVRNIAVWLVLGAVASLPALAQVAPGVSSSAAQQISDVLKDKKQILKSNPKLDLNLYFASKLAQGQLNGKSYAKAVTPPGTDSNGLVTVIVRGTLTSALQAKIASIGGKVIQNLPKYNYARVQVPLTGLESISTMAGVTRIGADEQATTNTLIPSLRLGSRGQSRSALSFAIGRMLSPKGYLPFVGALTSQGIVSHRANQAWPLGATGAGVRVGVLSDSASPATVAALVASGDLPADVTIVPGQAGAGQDEGTAMMEIVHDMAPGAKLFFATAFDGVASFADNIRTLRNTYGCDIIVDDITYYNEAAFQDGSIAQAVNDVVASGALYFSSAANSGNVSRGTAGTWEGDFASGGAVGGPIGGFGETGLIHNFGSASSPLLYDTLIAPSTFISLKWADPIGASANDYDLFVLDSTGTAVKGFSVQTQNGTQDPFEFVFEGNNCGTSGAVGYCPTAGDRFVFVLFNGSPRALRLDTSRGRLALATPGSTYGHNAGANTVSMAAVYWNSGGKGAQPFTGGAMNPIETFSSDGPRKIFFQPDGTPITPGNFLFSTSGGQTLQKPDFAAADGVAAKTPGFFPFFGTSAAAPHAAAIAALVKSAKPAYTNVQIYNALKATTSDNMAVGLDRDSGYGILNALAAVKYAQSH